MRSLYSNKEQKKITKKWWITFLILKKEHGVVRNDWRSGNWKITTYLRFWSWKKIIDQGFVSWIIEIKSKYYWIIIWKKSSWSDQDNVRIENIGNGARKRRRILESERKWWI